MKLVIESAHVREVTMVVAGIELPLTREQVVLALFGPDYEIVPIGGAKRAPAKREARREARGVLNAMIAEVLSDIGESSVPDIRAAILKKDPQFFEGKREEYLSGGLIRFVEKGALRRVGSRGAFLYSLAEGASRGPVVESAKPIAPPSWGDKSMTDVVIEVLSRRTVPLQISELKVVVEKKYPGIFEGRSPSLLGTTLTAMKTTQKLLKTTEVDGGKFAYALVKDWERVRARRAKARAASWSAQGNRLAKLNKGKSKKTGEQLHLNGAAPKQAAAAAEAVS